MLHDRESPVYVRVIAFGLERSAVYPIVDRTALMMILSAKWIPRRLSCNPLVKSMLDYETRASVTETESAK